jgi:hypothetical protein
MTWCSVKAQGQLYRLPFKATQTDDITEWILTGGKYVETRLNSKHLG